MAGDSADGSGSHGSYDGDVSLFQTDMDEIFRDRLVWQMLMLMILFMIFVDVLLRICARLAEGDRCHTMFVNRLNGELTMFGAVAISLLIVNEGTGKRISHHGHVVFEFVDVYCSVAACLLILVGVWCNILLFHSKRFFRKLMDEAVDWHLQHSRHQSSNTRLLDTQAFEARMNRQMADFFVGSGNVLSEMDADVYDVEHLNFAEYSHQVVGLVIVDLVDVNAVSWLTLMIIAVVGYIASGPRRNADITPQNVVTVVASVGCAIALLAIALDVLIWVSNEQLRRIYGSSDLGEVVHRSKKAHRDSDRTPEPSSLNPSISEPSRSRSLKPLSDGSLRLFHHFLPDLRHHEHPSPSQHEHGAQQQNAQNAQNAQGDTQTAHEREEKEMEEVVSAWSKRMAKVAHRGHGWQKVSQHAIQMSRLTDISEASMPARQANGCAEAADRPRQGSLPDESLARASMADGEDITCAQDAVVGRKDKIWAAKHIGFLRQAMQALMLLVCGQLSYYLIDLLHNIEYYDLDPSWHAACSVPPIVTLFIFLPHIVYTFGTFEAYAVPKADVLDNMLTDGWQLESDLRFVARQLVWSLVGTPGTVAQLRTFEAGFDQGAGRRWRRILAVVVDLLRGRVTTFYSKRHVFLQGLLDVAKVPCSRERFCRLAEWVHHSMAHDENPCDVSAVLTLLGLESLDMIESSFADSHAHPADQNLRDTRLRGLIEKHDSIRSTITGKGSHYGSCRLSAA